MRESWIETTLGDIAEVVGGGTPSTAVSEYWGGDIIWLTPTEITSQDGKVVNDSIRKISALGLKSSGARMLPKGSVILTSRASVGYVALAGAELCTNQGFQSLIPKGTVLANFLMFWIQQNRTEFESRSAGSTFKEISKSNVKSIKLSLPPLSEQKRIVHLISSVDFYIEALQQMVESVKETRKALLQELFTAGGDNWIETTIGDISRFISMRNAPDQLSTDSIYVGLEHLEPNITSINNFAFTSKVTSSLTPFEVGDVLFGRLRPYLHKVALAEIKGFCSPEILVLRANSKVLPQMLLLYCDADSTIKICVEKSAGTRMPRTSSDDLASIKVMLPSMPQQELIADLFGTFDANIARVNVSLEKTRVLRSGLLSDLLSGEHEIPTSYDKVMEAV
jgi:type I restriction enzyme S subunit